ncbi:probable carboxylesterase 15 [Nymphaea colorata]|nr:probable carboxylesterase 15 [Nymphaea colorata]
MRKEVPFEVENFRGIVRVFSDGSVIRSDDPSAKVPIEDDGSIAWKDFTFDNSFSLQLRIYKPSSIPDQKKLPIYIYFLAGGFCFGSRTWPIFHNFCLRLASRLQAVVIAPDHRWAPEYPLPSAIDDAFTAIKWVQTEFRMKNSASSLMDFADPKQVYISGNSSGGNICHHLAVGFAAQNLSPLSVRGYILITPGFSSEKRSPAELSCPASDLYIIEHHDCLWKLAVPKGSTRNHPLANPLGPNGKDLSSIKFSPVLVVTGTRDLIRDRQTAYVEKLRGIGSHADMVVFDGERHNFNYYNPKSAANSELMDRIKSFMAATSGETCKSRSRL